MKKQIDIDCDVVTMARRRIKNVFSNGLPVFMSVSGGKDSICLNALVYEMAVSGEIDASLLTIDFVDEEAIYPCVERIALGMRRQWQGLGVRFRWWACEFKHFNCFNLLTEDESFITWDRFARGRWVRPRPAFAITGHKRLKPRIDSYQDFLPRINKGGIQIVGLRATESIQRRNAVSSQRTTKDFAYPLYDWRDTDVWRFILTRGLDFPDAYLFMYQVGIPKNRMRISQFFSVDTAGSLVRMCEFYPDLFNKICRREPNAYLAMLYFETEFFRRGKKREDIDYKAKAIEFLKRKDLTGNQKHMAQRYRRFILSNSALIDQKSWRLIYEALAGGDPKARVFRTLYSNVFGGRSK